MKKTKIGALALSVALAAAICVPATAFADYAGSEQATQDSTGAAATDDGTIALDGTETTLTGTIKATTLSVSIPTTVAFNVDPGADQAVTDAAASDTGGVTTSNKHGQFTSPSNYKVKNLSRVKVYTYISSVAATASGTPGTTVTPELVDAAPDYSAAGSHAKVMIGIKSVAEKPADFGTQDNWLTTSLATKYYPFNATNKGEIAASTDGTTPVESDAMMIYGQVDKAGWTDGDTFQIKPTFTVTSIKPTI